MILKQPYEDGGTGYCFDLTGDVKDNSRLKFVHVLDSADGRVFIGEGTRFFDHTSKSKQRQNIINKINNLIDTINNK